MKKIFVGFFVALCALGANSSLRAAVIALGDFESEGTTVLTPSYTMLESRFSQVPAIYANPDTTGINRSASCFGYICKSSAMWAAATIELRLDEPILINANNRLLTLLVYRSNQAQTLSIGFNGSAAANLVYDDKLIGENRWERLVIDLGASHLNETLESLFFRHSMNTSGIASYYFDDIALSSLALPVAQISINPSEMYQEIDDFGASDCWTGNFIGRYWSDATKNFIAEKLFSRELDSSGNPKGIGLSNWRINVGAGTEVQGSASGIDDVTRRSECFLLEDGTYDWTKQSGQQFFMQKAKEYGVEHLLLFSNSPPIYFTKNGKGHANGGESGSNLKTDKYDEFGEFLATVAQHFVEEGYPIKYISPINEPQYDWTGGQEGSPWQNAQIKSTVKALNDALVARNSQVQILVPEAAEYPYLTSGSGRARNQIQEFWSKSGINYIGDLERVAPIVAGHSYWTFNTNAQLKNVRTALWDRAKTYDLRTAQTEWSMLDAAPSTETGFPASYNAASYMDIALFMGKLIYCDMVYANTSSWSYWTALANEVYSQKNRFFLIKCTPGNGAYGDWTRPGTAEANLNLWALGNYSLFIRPEYKRIRLDGANEMNHLLGSAYLSPDGKQLVCVYVNTSNNSRTVSVGFNDLRGEPIRVRQWNTNAANGSMKRNTALPSTYAGRNIPIPARTISTIVYDIDTTIGIEEITGDDAEQKMLSRTLVKAGETVEYASFDGRITLQSLSGAQYELRSGSGKLTIPNVAAGVYVLVFTQPDGSRFTQKLIIK